MLDFGAIAGSMGGRFRLAFVKMLKVVGILETEVKGKKCEDANLDEGLSSHEDDNEDVT